jgi:hypothetical protein
MGSRVFISYSRHDSEFVNHLIQDLERNRFSVWIDRAGIQAGESWRKSIVDAIDSCDCFVLVLSPHSVQSRNVTKEVSMADERHKRIFPIICQPCTIPADMEYQLTGVQYTDFAGEGYERALGRLLAALGAKAPAPPSPSNPSTGYDTWNTNVGPPPFTPVGAWQVQFTNPFNGMVIGYGQVNIDGSGGFALTLNTPNGMVQAQGRWQMMGAQMALQGAYALAAMPYQSFPYNLIIQITGAGPAGFAAVSQTGEQVAFQRIG